MRRASVFLFFLIATASLTMNFAFSKDAVVTLQSSDIQMNVVVHLKIDSKKFGGNEFSFWAFGEEIPSWVEGENKGTYDVWVKIPEVPRGELKVYIKHQKAKGWNPEDVFEYYDDFSATSTKDWFYYEVSTKDTKLKELKTRKCARFYVKNGRLYFKGGVKASICGVLSLNKKFSTDSVFRLRVWMWGDSLKLTVSESGYGEMGIFKRFDLLSGSVKWMVGSLLDPLSYKVIGKEVDLSDDFDDFAIVELSLGKVVVNGKAFIAPSKSDLKYLTFSEGLGRGTIALDYIIIYKPFKGEITIKY